MTKLQPTYSIPTSVIDKLVAVRQRTLKVRFGTALVAAFAVLLASMTLAMFVDWLATLYDARWRTVLTFAAIATAGATLVGWCGMAWRQLRFVDRVAADVDRRVPALQERWSTVTRVAAAKKTAGDVHPAMYRRVAEEAHAWSPRVELEEVVRLDGLVRALLCLTAVTAVLTTAVLLDSQRTVVMLRRFWSPQTLISATEISDLPGDLVVARGDSLDITGSLGGVAVEQATLMLKRDGDEIRNITLVPRGQDRATLNHRLRSVRTPLKYQVRAGDARSTWYEVEVADRPQLGEVSLTLTPPAYARREAEQIENLPRRLAAIEGTRLEIAFRPKVPVTRAFLAIAQKTEDEESEIDLSADADGWYRWQTMLSHDFSLSPRLIEEHGLMNRRPPICEIHCQPDKAPTVHILTPSNDVVVRANDKVPVSFVADDDIGIQSAELVVYDDRIGGGEPTVLDTIEVPLGDQQYSPHVQATVELDLAKYELADGSSLSFAVRVLEDRGQQNGAAPPQDWATQTAPMPAAAADNAPPQAGDATAVPAALVEDSTAQPAEPEVQELASQARPTATTDSTASEDTQRSKPLAPAAASAALEKTATADSNQGSTPANKGSVAPDAPAGGDSPPDTIPQLAKNERQPDSAEQAAAVPQSGRANQATSASRREPGDEKNPASPQDMANNEDDPSSLAAASPPPAPEADGSTTPSTEGRTASSGRQGLNTSSPQEPMPASGSDAAPNPALAAAQSGSAAMNNQVGNPSQPSSPGTSMSPPPDGMPGLALDVPQEAQSSSSKRLQLKVDQWAGSYSGQQRKNLEMSIAPKMAEIDKVLEKAQLLSHNVLSDVEAGAPWDNKHNRDIQGAHRHVATAIMRIDELKEITRGGPYAFVGLQLVDIGEAHIQPANQEFWTALESADALRLESTRNGWQHVSRARELLVMLSQRFERSRIEYQLADSVERIKKMYRVFAEDSLALLDPGGEGNRYRRKIAEFEFDEEYLKRLKEVIEMRAAMLVELARILEEDPRLLRRFLDSQRNRSKNLRNELDYITQRQEELNREVKAWTIVGEQSRGQLSEILMGRHLEAAQNIALAASELLDRFETWLPLARDAEDADLQATSAKLKQVAAASRKLAASGRNYIDATRRAKKRDVDANSGNAVAPAGEDSPAATEETPAGGKTLEAILSDAEQLKEHFAQLEVQLRQFGLDDERPEVAVFAVNRLLETRRLIERTAAWIRQLQEHRKGNYHLAAGVEQYRLATETDTLTGKLAGMEQALANLMQNGGLTMSQDVADNARAALAALDEKAGPNQLAAVYALRRNKTARATARQETALAGLRLAGKLFDEMMEAALKELDKLPVQDPVADILDDPTLDELLLGLEREVPIQELLGIPQRPTNLQVVGEWSRPSADMGGSGSRWRLLMNQLRQQQALRKQQLDRAYRRAVARALKEATAEDLVVDMPKRARDTTNWNRLVSELEDELEQGRDSAPPERYRRAIDQYFRQVSGSDDE